LIVVLSPAPSRSGSPDKSPAPTLELESRTATGSDRLTTRGAGRDERRRGHNKPVGQEVSRLATARQLANGEYSVHVTEAELSLMKTALETTERVSRFGMEVLDKADRAMDGRRSDNVRLRREIEALAMREASVRSLRKTMAAAEHGEWGDSARDCCRSGWLAVVEDCGDLGCAPG
jgi:hypothetical protein